MPPFLVSFACFQVFSIYIFYDFLHLLPQVPAVSREPGPMFDRLLGFDCITSKKASHEAPEQTHKHNVQLIQLIYTTFHNYGHILSYINHSFVCFGYPLDSTIVIPVAALSSTGVLLTEKQHLSHSTIVEGRTSSQNCNG